MRTFSDLIYYKQDIIDEYAAKRKNLNSKEVEDLLRCSLLFLEKEVKKDTFTAFAVPNVGFIHKKINFSNLDKLSKTIKREDNAIVESAYLETIAKPIVLRKDMLDIYYPDIDKQELQQIQNNK
jgi:hypothetical protein